MCPIRLNRKAVRYHNPMDLKTPTEYDRFTNLVDRVISVPKIEIQKREEEYKRQAATRPKRGPKPKNASPASGASPKRAN